MSRSNPYKRKKRYAKKTLLMYGEGLHEEIFLKYLRGLYSYKSGIRTKVRNGKGGSADSVVISAIREPGYFNKKVVILDKDRTRKEMQRSQALANKNNIELLINNPCFDALLLSILEKNTVFKSKKSEWCKKKFESEYLNKNKRIDKSEYCKIFPKSLLNKR